MLVTLEGLDGSGKTTVWERLRADDAVPSDAVFTREPTESWYGDAVQRSIDDDDADSLAELFLYTADHAAHLSDTVRPALTDGRLVVSDRYSDSRYAYQGATLAGTGHFEDPLAYVRDVHAPWTRPPDLTVYLDLDPATAARRSGATNKFEAADYLAGVRENYERLLDDDPDRFVRVDATDDPDAVYDRVRSALLDRL
ncbi:dTMP kinase [Haloarcula litorea]|uniref:dTMP kinase n=1 Tax=Haloarcula litorea TaxID=3032579 RepID=UPI0023E75896|nr:dTMP kinase [Halomicroarcula sp. GDY20]